MLDHRSSSSSRLLKMDGYEDSAGLDGVRHSAPWESPSALPMFATKRRRRRTVPLCVFVTAVIFFSVVALALGLGLGLGWARYKNKSIPAQFKDSSYYGSLEDLVLIPPEQLTNTKELDLDTGFVVSDQPRTREYVFNISQALAAPDGVPKPMILANRQSPGPLIEANIGDTKGFEVRVHVTNLMPSASTTIHWHGIDQRNTTWMDGVTGVSQCGIPPGRNFTYEFRIVGQRGTFWWHAHSSVQYSDGLYGPIVVHDADEMVPETDDEKTVFVSDVYHTHGSVLLPSYLNSTSRWASFESGVEPLADNILLNGQSTYECAVVSTTYPPPSSGEPSSSSPSTPAPRCTGGRLYTTKIRTGQQVRLRLINASSFFSYWLSIDNHSLSIIELDGVEISPVVARGVYLNIGQRASVIITANQTAGNYYIRATLPETCFLPYVPYTSAGLEAGGYLAKGILSYDDVPVDATPIGVMSNVSNPYGVGNNGARGGVWEGCDDMPFDLPRPMREVPAYEVPEQNKHYIEYMFRQAQDVNRIFINKTAYAPLTDNATLWKAMEQEFVVSKANAYNSWDFGLNQQVLLVPDADTGAQVVINSRDAMEHPWHLQSVNLLSYVVIPLFILLGLGPHICLVDMVRGIYAIHPFPSTGWLTLISRLCRQLLQPWVARSNNPLFKTGHTFQIVGWGPDLFGTAAPSLDDKDKTPMTTTTTTTTTTWNLGNPMRRDTVTVPAFSHVVIRFETDNPGLWALHCHVAWHMEGGMFVSLIERPSDLVTLVEAMDPATRILSQNFCSV
ncbi:Cupredoxin [Nemania diffusa]|nr:Cupredoxin [Nemania diffusa]